MNGSEFQQYIDIFPSIKNYFKGVFSIDLIPSSLKKYQFCICNNDTSNGKGKHWFIILKINKNTCELFDSLGFTDDKINYFKNFNKIKNNIIFNETQFQPNDFDSCGLFCIYFIIERLHNVDLDFDDLLSNIFKTNDLNYNENIVKKFSIDILNDFEDEY